MKKIEKYPVILSFLKNGSGIHIKKKNRGKFTDYCGGKVTNECIRKAKASGNPTLVKRATFAANVRKWKHQLGGLLKAQEGMKTVVPKENNTLPEITVTPDKYTLNKIQEMIPNRNLRRAFLNSIDTPGGMQLNYDGNNLYKTYDGPIRDTNEYANRVYSVWDYVGKPKVRSSSDNPLGFIIGKDRPMASPTGTIYISEKNPHLEAELPHFYQYTQPDTKYGRFDSIPFISGNLPADIKVNGKTAYDRPDTFEYEAHRVIEPEMRRFFNGTTPDRYIMYQRIKKKLNGNNNK